MNKAEAIEYAKKAVKLLKKEAIEDIRRCGPGSYLSGCETAYLVRKLEIPTESWSDRSKIRAAMTRALKEAEVLGLVRRQYNAWVYCGPGLKEEGEKYEARKAAAEKELADAAKTLGVKAVENGSMVRLERKAFLKLAKRWRAKG